MLAQAIARLSIQDDICPQCSKSCDLLSLTLTIRDLSGEERELLWEGCVKCTENAELVSKITTGDVIQLYPQAARRSQNKKARKREEAAGRDIGGNRVPGSGAQEAKGDARNSCWMVEDKHTSDVSYRLTRAVMAKAVGQAAKTGRNAVVKVGLHDVTELAICLWTDFQEVINDEIG